MIKGIYNCQFVIAPIRSHEREENLRLRAGQQTTHIIGLWSIQQRISFLNWFVWVMWRLFSVGLRNLCLWWSLKNLNYTKSNKSFFYILLTMITKKKKTYTSIQSLTISFYEFIYLFIFILKSLYDSFIINAANYISFKILIQ